MRDYEVRFTREAVKDIGKLSPKLRLKLKQILVEKIAKEPYTGKRLMGDLKGFYSVRLTLKDRIVYVIDENARTVFVQRARTHYGE
jgi:mRNA-degrading endonuclease RelE of RelBE toxin-antitoxin system